MIILKIVVVVYLIEVCCGWVIVIIVGDVIVFMICVIVLNSIRFKVVVICYKVFEVFFISVVVGV